MKIFRFVAFFSLALIHIPDLLAYTLEGRVLGLDGNPVESATISIYNDFHDEIGRGYSDRKGEYQIKNLPAGTYTLEAKKSKFPRYSITIEINGPDNTVLYQDINFSDLSVHSGITKSDLIQLYLPVDYPIKSNFLHDYRKGLDLISQKEFKKAIKKFTDLIKKDPNFSRAYLQLAIIAQVQQREQDSLDLLEKACSLNPADPLPFLHLAELYLNDKKLELAEKQIDMAEKLDTTLFQIHLLRGELFYYQGKLNDSQLEFMQVLHLNLPPNKEASVKRFLGEIELSKGRLTNARNYFNAYLKYDPDASDAEEIHQKIREIERQISVEQ
jgi:tetratricopeptide (TPR) repeat protein